MKEYEAEELFVDEFNDTFPMVNIAGFEYFPAYALKNVDPIAYRETFLDWCDARNIELED